MEIEYTQYKQKLDLKLLTYCLIIKHPVFTDYAKIRFTEYYIDVP